MPSDLKDQGSLFKLQWFYLFFGISRTEPLATNFEKNKETILSPQLWTHWDGLDFFRILSREFGSANKNITQKPPFLWYIIFSAHAPANSQLKIQKKSGPSGCVHS